MTSGFTSLAIKLLRDRSHMGSVLNPTHISSVGIEGGGDYVVLEIRVTQNQATEVRYRCNGCPTTVATCEILATLLEKSDWDKIHLIDESTIRHLLGTPSESKNYVPGFVARILTKLIDQECK